MIGSITRHHVPVRPLLLLDVDGVLSPAGQSLPPGYVRHATSRYDVAVSPKHAVWLAELLELFDPVWATTWEEQAQPIFGQLLNLPPMPHITFDRLSEDGTRKLVDVAEYVGSRSIAWVDDELYEDAFAWAERRSAPTLLVRTRSGVGLCERDVEALIAFGRAQLSG